MPLGYTVFGRFEERPAAHYWIRRGNRHLFRLSRSEANSVACLSIFLRTVVGQLTTGVLVP